MLATKIPEKLRLEANRIHAIILHDQEILHRQLEQVEKDPKLKDQLAAMWQGHQYEGHQHAYGLQNCHNLANDLRTLQVEIAELLHELSGLDYLDAEIKSSIKKVTVNMLNMKSAARWAEEPWRIPADNVYRIGQKELTAMHQIVSKINMILGIFEYVKKSIHWNVDEWHSLGAPIGRNGVGKMKGLGVILLKIKHDLDFAEAEFRHVLKELLVMKNIDVEVTREIEALRNPALRAELKKTPVQAAHVLARIEKELEKHINTIKT